MPARAEGSVFFLDVGNDLSVFTSGSNIEFMLVVGELLELHPDFVGSLGTYLVLVAGGLQRCTEADVAAGAVHLHRASTRGNDVLDGRRLSRDRCGGGGG